MLHICYLPSAQIHRRFIPPSIYLNLSFSSAILSHDLYSMHKFNTLTAWQLQTSSKISNIIELKPIITHKNMNQELSNKYSFSRINNWQKKKRNCLHNSFILLWGILIFCDILPSPVGLPIVFVLKVRKKRLQGEQSSINLETVLKVNI